MKQNKGIALIIAIILFAGCACAIQKLPNTAVPETAAPELSASSVNEGENTDALTPEDRAKISSWEYIPEDQVYLAYKEVFDNPRYYNQETGEINWPPNDGAVEGTNEQVVLEAGTQIDRFGSEDGFFTSPIDTPYEQRSCAPGSDQKPYYQYEVVKPIEGVEQGVTAPWFDEPGGGLQYKMPASVKELVDGGYLKQIN